MSKERLILLFDGTWNDPQDQTNVYRTARRIKDFDGEIAQRFFYDPGVGTRWWDRLLGGVTGYGLSANMLQGYDWLARNYSEGDEIWIFGFSRGAYTARSLGGLIRKCGLLHISTPNLLRAAEAMYRDKSLHPDSQPCIDFKRNYSRQPRIHFMGVWDTVGSLGVPGLLSERGYFAWHDTMISGIVDHAYHAMALDELRALYKTALWTSKNGQPKPGNIDVQQRWFIGAHANVGGGYGAGDSLADIPLQWMLERASQCGLKLEEFKADGSAWKARPRDSYQEFLNGKYAMLRQWKTRDDGKYHREYAHAKEELKAINVSVDDTVWQRWREDPEYRPKTLLNAGVSPPEQSTQQPDRPTSPDQTTTV